MRIGRLITQICRYLSFKIKTYFFLPGFGCAKALPATDYAIFP